MVPIHIAKSDQLDDWIKLSDNLDSLQKKMWSIQKEYEDELHNLKGILTRKKQWVALVDKLAVIYDDFHKQDAWGEPEAKKEHIWTYTQRLQNITNRLMELSGELMDISQEYQMVSEELSEVDNMAQKQFKEAK